MNSVLNLNYLNAKNAKKSGSCRTQLQMAFLSISKSALNCELEHLHYGGPLMVILGTSKVGPEFFSYMLAPLLVSVHMDCDLTFDLRKPEGSPWVIFWSFLRSSDFSNQLPSPVVTNYTVRFCLRAVKLSCIAPFII